MPHPREAIHDVLKAKQDRLKEEQRTNSSSLTLRQAFERWTNDNKRSRNLKG